MECSNAMFPVGFARGSHEVDKLNGQKQDLKMEPEVQAGRLILRPIVGSRPSSVKSWYPGSPRWTVSPSPEPR
jgi:hypothetical protein